MQTLTVVNDMLGTMGEAPLNTLDDPHTFRGACLSTLNTHDRNLQAQGWWYNMENLTLAPSALSSEIYVPGDTIAVRAPTRNVVQRGRRLYDLDAGLYIFTASVDLVLIRLVPFEELPESMAAYIAATAVHAFQTRYDGDTAKSRELAQAVQVARAATNIDHIRNRKSNFIDSNAKLQRLKAHTWQSRVSITR